MIWSFLAAVIAAITAIIAVRRSERTRLRVWREALVVAILGLALAIGGGVSGNLAAFYGGSLAAFIGVLVWAALAIVIYRADRRTLGPTRVSKF